MFETCLATQPLTPESLIAEATAILNRAETQHRDLSDFESGRVDALLDVAGRISREARQQNHASTEAAHDAIRR